MKLASEIRGASATVFYTEEDLRRRELIVKILKGALSDSLVALNPSIRIIQVETPTLLPTSSLQSHRDVGFELCDVPMHDQTLTLRPETTLGTLSMLDVLYPQKEQLKKRLPICLWQVGKVYRNEQIRPFSELRFREFYQLEFQLIASQGSKAPYMITMLNAVEFPISLLTGSNVQSCSVADDDLAHYSKKTYDIYINQNEVGAISERDDLENDGLMLYEASFGLDRLTALCKL